jgi:hypothetical protein
MLVAWSPGQDDHQQEDAACSWQCQNSLQYLFGRRERAECEGPENLDKALSDELDKLKKKKRCMEKGIKGLGQAADSYPKAMERKGGLKIIAKFNAIRKSSKTKQQELDILELNIKEIVDKTAAS